MGELPLVNGFLMEKNSLDATPGLRGRGGGCEAGWQVEGLSLDIEGKDGIGSVVLIVSTCQYVGMCTAHARDIPKHTRDLHPLASAVAASSVAVPIFAVPHEHHPPQLLFGYARVFQLEKVNHQGNSELPLRYTLRQVFTPRQPSTIRVHSSLSTAVETAVGTPIHATSNATTVLVWRLRHHPYSP